MARQSLLVTPSYRDADRLAVFGPALARTLADAKMNIRWVMADDGSGRTEVEKLNRLCQQLQAVYPKVEVFSPGRHLGKGGIIHQVWRSSHEDEWLCFIDADGSVDGETFVTLLKEAQQAGKGNAIIGSRRESPETKVTQTAFRRLSHKIMGLLIQMALDLPVIDTQCGAKCIHSENYRAIEPILIEPGLLFDSELLLALADSGVKLVEIPVNWIEKPGGTVSPLRDAIPMLWSLVKLRRRLRAGKI
ncbi:MAG: glycosyltransferase [Verrucomicrobiota bacterium]